MSKLFILVKKLFLATFFIYGYNLLAQYLNLVIPLNFFTIIYVTIFSSIGLFSLIVIMIFGL